MNQHKIEKKKIMTSYCSSLLLAIYWFLLNKVCWRCVVLAIYDRNRCHTGNFFDFRQHNKTILGECLLISSLSGKALRTHVDIARLAERFSKRLSKLSLVNLISKDANLVFYLSVYPLFHSSN